MFARLIRSGARWLVEEALDWGAAVLLLLAVIGVSMTGSWLAAAVVLPLAVLGVFVLYRAVRPSRPSRPPGSR